MIKRIKVKEVLKTAIKLADKQGTNILCKTVLYIPYKDYIAGNMVNVKKLEPVHAQSIPHLYQVLLAKGIGKSQVRAMRDYIPQVINERVRFEPVKVRDGFLTVFAQLDAKGLKV